MQVEDKRAERTSVEEFWSWKKFTKQTHNKYQSSLSTSIKLFPPITFIFYRHAERVFVFCHFYEYNFIELCLNAFKFYVKTQQSQNNDYTIEKGRWCKMCSQSWQKSTITTLLSCSY